MKLFIFKRGKICHKNWQHFFCGFPHLLFLIKRPFRVSYLIEVHFLPKCYSTYTDLFTNLKFGRNWNSIWYIPRNCLEQKIVISSHSFALILFFQYRNAQGSNQLSIFWFSPRNPKTWTIKVLLWVLWGESCFQKGKKISFNLWFWVRYFKTVKSSRYVLLLNEWYRDQTKGQQIGAP